MKKLFKSRILLGFYFGIAGSISLMTPSVYGDGCDGVTACQTPGTSGLSAPNILVSQFTQLDIKNSATATANATNTWFWFFATTATAPSTATGSTEFIADVQGDRVRADSNLLESNLSPSASDLLTNAKISTLLASTNYNIYAQACQSGDFNVADPTHIACSDWVLVFSNQVTQNLPTNIFSNVATTDVSSGSLRVVTTVPDFTEVQSASITIHNAQGTGADGVLSGIAYTSNGVLNIGYNATPQSFPAGYPWIPNTHYTYAGQLIYPHNQRTSVQSVPDFYTRPTEPGPISIPLSEVTHCSAVVIVKNANATPANPSYTGYHACTSGFGVVCLDQVIGGTGLQNDTTTFVFTHLTPAQTYGANALAKNENSGWPDSALTTSSTYTFTTLSWGNPTGSTPNVWNTSATYHVSGIDNTSASIVNYQIVLDGVNFGSVQPWTGGTTVNETITATLTGLIPNTAHTAQVILNEATCATDAFANATFTTTPTIPTPTSFTAPTARSLSLAWGVNGNNTAGAGTTFEVSYTSDSSFATGVSTVPTAANATTLTITNSGPTPVSPETTYFSRIRAVNISLPTWPDSPFASFGSVPTPNEAPTISSLTCAAPSGTTTTCGGQASDNGPLTQLICHWTVDNGASLTSTQDQNANSSGVCPTVGFSFPVSATYHVMLVVTDHNGVGGLSSAPSTVTVGAAQTPSQIDLSPTNPIVGRGQPVTFSATVFDQYTPPSTISGEPVFWSIPAMAGSLSAGHSVSTIFTAGNTVGTYNLDATDGTSASTSTPVNVEANTVAVSPSGHANIGPGSPGLQFSAAVTNPQHATITPTITWSISGCNALNTLSTSGLLSAAAADSTACVITATTQYGDTGTASITVQADTVNVTPATPPNIGTGGTQQFTAAVTLPQGGTITPTITWSFSACDPGNSIDNSGPTPGLFHANVASVTPCVIKATTQYGDAGTAAITVDNSLPSVTVQPTATVFVTTAALSVSGTGFHGSTNLIYTWSLVSPLGTSVDFSSQNGTTAGHDVIATFHAIGTYVFKATLTDVGVTPNVSNSANTTPVVVVSVLSRITVSPTNITIQALNDQTFTAAGLDQFGHATSPGNVVWSTSGGNISGAGVFNSPGLGNNITVQARNGSIVGTANVNVISFDVSGAYAYPVPFKSTRDTAITFTGLGSSSQIHIYTTAGREVFSINLSQNQYPWNVRNSSGDKVASGVYFYFIQSPAGKKDGKLIIIQ